MKKIFALVLALIMAVAVGAVTASAASVDSKNPVGITVVKNRDVLVNQATNIPSVAGFSEAFVWKLPDGTFWTIGIGPADGRLSKVGQLVNEAADDNAAPAVMADEAD